MTLRRSTRVWIVIFVVALAASAVIDRAASESGCWGAVTKALATLAGSILLWRIGAAAFRLIVRRLALRLAFSYFLIGLVPIPLLAALLSLTAYVVANQFAANRLRREVTAVGEAAARSGARLPTVAVDSSGKVSSSDVKWLPPGASAAWAHGLARPSFLVEGDDVWLAVATEKPGTLRLLRLNDPEAPWLQQLADATGYETGAAVGTSRQEGSTFTIDEKPQETGVRIGKRKLPNRNESVTRFPRATAPPGKGLVQGGWLHAFYLETAINAAAEKAEEGRNVAVLTAVTSPETIFRQLFSQGVDEISRVFRIAFVVLIGIVLFVYAVALSIAFVLVGSITRAVNRLTRASAAAARGDFSVRVESKSRDQIGDLARSFDGMAASIQRLLLDTARKERLESEIAIARTIQHKLLPPTEASLDGAAVLAHFEPVAEIGGDYYDYLRMPDGRLAFALGDVSGHGLPTGLLVAMAKAGLSSLVEAGHEGGELFSRMNELIHRSTDPRHFMTLALLAYDAATRTGTLTNAGQLAPYRISGARIEALALPAFPLGLFPGKAFPSRTERFSAGDTVVFYSDGLIEAVDANEEAFGFERFEAVLLAHAPEGAAALRDAILSAVATHAGNRPADDDRTLLILTLA